MKHQKTFENLIKRKGLNPKVFIPGATHFSDHIATHAAWAFENIYSVRYATHPVSSNDKDDEIARIYHGIEHVTSAAIYGVVFTNFYRRHKHPEALRLTSFGLKLILLGLIFHDSAREGDDEDLWDHESGLLLYFYLTLVLELDHATAKFMAEAVANKDQSVQGYQELAEEDGELIWKYGHARPKNISEIIIQNADCIDVSRARDHFDLNLLDGYQHIVKQTNGTASKGVSEPLNQQAFRELTKLIIESKSFIELRGDGRNSLNLETKKRYENKNVFAQLLATLDKALHPMIINLYADGQLLEDPQLRQPLWEEKIYDPSKGITAENLDALLLKDKPYMLIRGIGLPSALDMKERETLAHLELRKSYRTGNIRKNGNLNRSNSLIGYGAPIYAPVGFIIVNPDIARMSVISSIDCDTDRGKKKKKSQHDISSLPVDEKEKMLIEVQQKQKMGGNSRRLHGYVDVHSEIGYWITDFDAIYYTNDPVIFNYICHDHQKPYHQHAPVLQALFLTFEHLGLTNKRIPLFEYSGIHNFIRPTPDYSTNEIVKMWEDLIENFYNKQIAAGKSIEDMLEYSLDNLKTQGMYGKIEAPPYIAGKNAPADSNYPTALKTEVDKAITKLRERLTLSYIRARIKSKPLSVFSDDLFFHLLHYPEIRYELNHQIQTELQKVFDDIDWEGTYRRDINSFIFSDLYKKERYKAEKQVYSIYTGLRIYALARLTNDQTRVDLIKSTVRTIFDERLKHNSNSSDYDSLESILGFSLFFDLYEEYAVRINNKLTDFLVHIETSETNSYDLDELQTFTFMLVKFGMVNRNIHNHLDRILQHIISQVDFSKNPSSKLKLEHTKYVLNNPNRTTFRLIVNRIKLDLINSTDFSNPQKSQEQFLPTIAAYNGRVDLIATLHLSKANLEQVSSDGWTASHAAVEVSAGDVIEKLHSYNININFSSNDGLTPFAMAVERGDLPLVKIFIKAKIHLTQGNKENSFIVKLAAQKGHAEIITVFAQEKIPLNEMDENNLTPIMHAARQGHVNAVKALNEAGICLKQSTKEGGTLLHLAAEQDELAIAEYLINEELDVGKKNDAGLTPLQIARKNGHRKVAYCLESCAIYFSTLTTKLGFLADAGRKNIKHDPEFQEFLMTARNG